MVATTPASRKMKGRSFQQLVRDLIIGAFSELLPDDVRSTSMGASGVDVQLSPLAQSKFPFAVECKNQEKVSLWSWWEQAVENSTDKLKPILFIKKANRKPLVVLEAHIFMQLMSELRSK